MNSLFVVERIVLEAINNKSINLNDLKKETGLEEEFLLYVLSCLEKRKIIKNLKGDYFLNLEEKSKWIESINSMSALKNELGDVFGNIIKQFVDEKESKEGMRTELKIKKIYLTDSEDKIYKSLLYNLDSFIKNTHESRKKQKVKETIKEKKVIFWGNINYGDLVNRSLINI